MLPLVRGAETISTETRARMIEQLGWFTKNFNEWLTMIDDVRHGVLDAKTVAITSAAFRPNFHASKGEDHLLAGQWTEATVRFVLATETLLRDVITIALQESLQLNLSTKQLTTYWRQTVREVAALAGFDLAADAAWQEFAKVYDHRNKRFAHGHDEATVDDAFRARSAWSDMRDLMQTAFAQSHGISLEAVQAKVLHRRAEEMSDDDRAAATAAIEQAVLARNQGAVRLRGLSNAHQPKQLLEVAMAYDALSRAGRKSADAAFADALALGFREVQETFSRLTDIDSVLVDAAFGADTENALKHAALGMLRSDVPLL